MDEAPRLDGRAAPVPPWAVALARLMDEAFVVPILNRKIGLDAIIGFLAPGLGDALSAGSGILLIGLALTTGVPGVVLLRMAANVAIDGVIGAIPLIGDLFDVGWKANTRNVALIERFGRPSARPAPADYAFAALSLTLVAAILLLPLILAGWLLARWLG